jgi:hypothetical protein
MRRNYYGRRARDHDDNQSTTAWKKYKETIEKAKRSADPVEATALYQLAEHYFKLAKNIK